MPRHRVSRAHFVGWRALLLPLLAVMGCQAIAGLTGVTFGEGAGGGGGGGGAGAGGTGGGAGGSGGGQCGSVVPPARTAGDSGGTDQEIVLAMRTIDFGEASLADGPGFGYDLDGRCTCDTDSVSCEPPAAAPADSECDGPDGRDNNMARVFQVLSVTSDVSSPELTGHLESGSWTLLFRIRGYNGLANDDQVEVVVFSTRRLADDPCFPGPGPNGNARWDGTDRWPVLSTALEDGVAGAGGGGGAGGAPGCSGPEDPRLEMPKYVDDNGYVADRTLVANLPTVEMVISGTTVYMPMRITGGFLTGQLVEDVDGWRISDGVLAGRFGTKDIFDLLSGLRLDDGPVCTDDPGYNLIQGLLCAHLDVQAGVVGPTTPCDALSFGASFQAQEATVGAVVDPETPASFCPPDTDPITDDCNG